MQNIGHMHLCVTCRRIIDSTPQVTSLSRLAQYIDDLELGEVHGPCLHVAVEQDGDEEEKEEVVAVVSTLI